jgi:DNA-directed RNA polymerase specialized sigma24 family protein
VVRKAKNINYVIYKIKTIPKSLSWKYMEYLNETELLELICSGQWNALHELRRREGESIHRVLKQIMLRPEDIERAWSETFESFWANAPQIKRDWGDRPTLALYRLALMAGHRIDQGRQSASMSREESFEDLPAPSMQRFELGLDLEHLCSAISAQDRRLLELRGYHGMTFQAIADQVGLPLRTVQPRSEKAGVQIRVFAKQIGYEP